MKVTVKGIFWDKDSPRLKRRVDESLCMGVLHEFIRQFAGLKAVEIHGPEQIDIYNAAGQFLFGIDKKDIQEARTT